MGSLISFKSTRVLLQREDRPAALAALRRYAAECPDGVEGGDPGGDDLVAVLDAWGWGTRADGYGDVTGLWYRGDKAPRGTDGFPYGLVEALAPSLRYGTFLRSEEQVPELSLYVVGRRERVSVWRRPGVWLRQRGAPPVVLPGEPVVVRFELEDFGLGGKVRVETRSSQAGCEPREVTVDVGAVCEVVVTPRPGAAGPLDVRVQLSADGYPTAVFGLDLRLEAPDAGPGVVSVYSWLDDPEREGELEADIPVGNVHRACEALRRNALRHVNEPGGGFLQGVLDASDFRAALNAANLDSEPTASGGFGGFRFVGDRLPGPERYLWGLFASLEGLVTGEAGFEFAAGDPVRKVGYQYYWDHDSVEWGRPLREV